MKIDLYLHSSKESAYDAGLEAGLSEQALENFKYAGYEEKMTYEVCELTGKAILVSVNDRDLQS